MTFARLFFVFATLLIGSESLPALSLGATSPGSSPEEHRLDATGISEARLPNAGPVGHWSFDEAGKALYVEDMSGSRNHGAVVVSAEANAAKRVEGPVGQALRFTGSERVIVRQSASLNFGDTMSMSFWIRYTGWSRPEFGHYLAKWDGQTGWIVSNSGKSRDIYINIGTSHGPYQYCGHVPNVLDGQWHHMAFVIDRGSCTIYKDGHEMIVNSNRYDPGATGFSNTADFVINPIGNMTGALDDIRLYNRVLARSEIAALHELGTPQSSLFYRLMQWFL